MSDENANKPEWTPPASQDELNRIIAERLSRQKEKLESEFTERFSDYDELKAKAEQLDTIEDGKKDDLQKAIERAEAAEKAIANRDAAEEQRKAEEKAAQELEALRKEVAEAKGIDDPSILWGTTREELEERADKLKPLINPHPVNPDPGKTPDNEPSEEAAFVQALFGGNS